MAKTPSDEVARGQQALLAAHAHYFAWQESPARLRTRDLEGPASDAIRQFARAIEQLRAALNKFSSGSDAPPYAHNLAEAKLLGRARMLGASMTSAQYRETFAQLLDALHAAQPLYEAAKDLSPTGSKGNTAQRAWVFAAADSWLQALGKEPTAKGMFKGALEEFTLNCQQQNIRRPPSVGETALARNLALWRAVARRHGV